MTITPVSWSDDLRTGIQQIDREHQTLVELAGALQDAIATGKPALELDQRCAALIEHARNHFNAEEGLMLAWGYRGYAEHQKEHRRLLDQLGILRQSLSANAGGDLLIAVMRSWTVPHIVFADRQFAVFLQQSGYTEG